MPDRALRNLALASELTASFPALAERVTMFSAQSAVGGRGERRGIVADLTQGPSFSPAGSPSAPPRDGAERPGTQPGANRTGRRPPRFYKNAVSSPTSRSDVRCSRSFDRGDVVVGGRLSAHRRRLFPTWFPVVTLTSGSGPIRNDGSRAGSDRRNINTLFSQNPGLGHPRGFSGDRAVRARGSIDQAMMTSATRLSEWAISSRNRPPRSRASTSARRRSCRRGHRSAGPPSCRARDKVVKDSFTRAASGVIGWRPGSTDQGSGRLRQVRPKKSERGRRGERDPCRIDLPAAVSTGRKGAHGKTRRVIAPTSADPDPDPSGTLIRGATWGPWNRRREDAASASFLDGKSAIRWDRKQSAPHGRGAKKVKAELEVLKPRIEKAGASYTVPTDNSTFIEHSINDVRFDLIFGAFLAVVIILLFLRDVRATLISAVAIPTSVIASFAFMEWLDFTFNNMTMLALSLSIGILIDDAIVVIENIHRHLELGEPPAAAASNATAEIFLRCSRPRPLSWPFRAVAMMKGIVGRFFFQSGSRSALRSRYRCWSLTLTRCCPRASWSRSRRRRAYIYRGIERTLVAIEQGTARVIRWALSAPPRHSRARGSGAGRFIRAGLAGQAGSFRPRIARLRAPGRAADRQRARTTEEGLRGDRGRHPQDRPGSETPSPPSPAARRASRIRPASRS